MTNSAGHVNPKKAFEDNGLVALKSIQHDAFRSVQMLKCCMKFIT
jgi:hypothetical protein